jgi:hypothetical protein
MIAQAGIGSALERMLDDLRCESLPTLIGIELQPKTVQCSEKGAKIFLSAI